MKVGEDAPLVIVESLLLKGVSIVESEYCREHKDLLIPLQESIDEDAKDLEKKKTVDEGTDAVTYKKVYKFVRTW